MAHPETLREQVRHAYIQDGMPLPWLAKRFSVGAATLARWKKEDAQRGDDWDAKQGAALLASESIEQNGREVLAALMRQIKSAMQQVEHDGSLEPADKVELLASLSDAFNKAINAFNRVMPKTSELAVVQDTLQKLTRFTAMQFPAQRAEMADILSAFVAFLAKG